MNQTNSNKPVYIAIGVIVVIVIIILIAMSGGSATNTPVDNQPQTDQLGNPVTGTTGGNGTVQGGSQSPTAGTIPSDATLLTMISSSLIRVPETGVDAALTQGQADFTDGTVKGHVVLGSLLGKVTTNDGYDVYSTLTVTKVGRSGNSVHLAVFHVNGQNAQFTSSIAIGDRLPVTSILAARDPRYPAPVNQTYMDSKAGYLLTVNYLDRKNGESASTTPSVSKTVTFHVEDHLLRK